MVWPCIFFWFRRYQSNGAAGLARYYSIWKGEGYWRLAVRKPAGIAGAIGFIVCRIPPMGRKGGEVWICTGGIAPLDYLAGKSDTGGCRKSYYAGYTRRLAA